MLLLEKMVYIQKNSIQNTKTDHHQRTRSDKLLLHSRIHLFKYMQTIPPRYTDKQSRRKGGPIKVN